MLLVERQIGAGDLIRIKPLIGGLAAITRAFHIIASR
jgi:hypothetical protein